MTNNEIGDALIVIAIIAMAVLVSIWQDNPKYLWLLALMILV